MRKLAYIIAITTAFMTNDVYASAVSEEDDFRESEGSAFLCPISLEVMVNPVITIEDGHSYDEENIQRWFAHGKRTSPKTGLPLTDTRTVPNHALRGAILEAGEAVERARELSARLLTARQEAEEATQKSTTAEEKIRETAELLQQEMEQAERERRKAEEEGEKLRAMALDETAPIASRATAGGTLLRFHSGAKAARAALMTAVRERAKSLDPAYISLLTIDICEKKVFEEGDKELLLAAIQNGKDLMLPAICLHTNGSNRDKKKVKALLQSIASNKSDPRNVQAASMLVAFKTV